MSPKPSLDCLGALANVDTGQLLIELELLQSKPDKLAEARSAQEPEALAKDMVSYEEPASHMQKAVISPDELAIQRASTKNYINAGLSRRDAIHGTFLRLFAGMVTKHQENVRARRTAIIAEAVRSGEDIRSGTRNSRLLMQEIAGARSTLTAEEVIIKAGFDPSQFPALSYAAHAFVPSRRRRNVALTGLAVASLWLVAERGGTDVSTAEQHLTAESNTSSILAKRSVVQDEITTKKAEEKLVAGPTTTASTTTTTTPKPTITAFQLGLAKPLKVQLPPEATAEQAAAIISAATYEEWDTATVNAYIGPEKFPHPGGEVIVNDCQGEDVDLIRSGDNDMAKVARDNGMTEEQVWELNERNTLIFNSGLCGRLGEGNKGVKAEGA